LLLPNVDVPVIISGERVGYLDPQERIWPGESGKAFTLQELQNTDNLTPFNGVSDFVSSRMKSYPKTIFRFPLRKKPSDLSQALYDVSKVKALINALCEEAKLLLVFLHSVDTIEVINISDDGHQQLSFKVEISDEFKHRVRYNRQNLLGSLKSEYLSKSYNISRYFDYTSIFNIKVSGVDLNEAESGESSWLVCNQVGSDNEAVLEAAMKQKIFPRVGVALELEEIAKTGRVFCILPLPIEAASNLPVHVNGTFVPTDDRRSLKWPGVERKNDAKADWNMMLVKDILPRCYVTMLNEAKGHLSFDQIYRAWPCESIIDKNTWGKLLKPMYRSLFEHPAFWSETSREWVKASEGIFIQKDAELNEVVHQCLSSCGVKVVSIKQCDNVWAALKLASVKVTSVLPKLVRDRLRSSTTYMTLGREEKCAILDYCLSDKWYSDLVGLHLLPLLNGKFAQIQEGVPEVASIFVASESYPSVLLPNLSHMLIDLADENLSLHKKVSKLAESQVTQVKTISQKEMLDLLDKTMPASWNNFELIPLPDPSFPIEWFELFWNWAEKKKLNTFVGKFILPVAPRRKDAQNPAVKFCISKLPTPKGTKAASSIGATLKGTKASSSKGATREGTSSRAVIYIPSGHECCGFLKDALDRFAISVCSQDDFPNVKHKNLSMFLEQFDTSGVLDAIDLTINCSEVKLTESEARALKEFIKPSGLSRRKRVLKKLNIFTTASNTKSFLLSVQQVISDSTFKKAVAVPQNTCLDISELPTSMIMFSQNDQSQIQLLRSMESDVHFPSDNQFILSYVFPVLEQGSLSNVLRDEIMIRILDNFHALRTSDSAGITRKVTNFPFVKTSANSDTCECPKHLYDPRNREIAEIFKGECLFPISPYDKDEYLEVLKLCGLQTTIKSDKILDVIREIGIPPTSDPRRVKKAKLARAKAVLQYIGKDGFLHSLINQEKFWCDLEKLSKEKCWIPVLSAPPPTLDYPSTLPWKGSDCKSHLMSLQAHPYYILSTADCTREPLLLGSEVYFSDPPVIPGVASMFSRSCPNFTKFTVRQLLHLTELDQETSSILYQLNLLYKELAMPANREQVKQYLDSASRWLYIPKQRRFVSPSAVAVEPNPTFYRHSLEPYIYLLPEQFADFKELFLEFGMHRQISESQIFQFLRKSRENFATKIYLLNLVKLLT
jgi:sacsin